MMFSRRALGAAAFCGAALVLPAGGFAHGFVGGRFFPATLTTDDPLATDELALPSVSFFDIPGGPGGADARVVDAGFEFDKLIFPKFTLGVSDDYLALRSHGFGSAKGWDDLSVSFKYQFWEDEAHEAVMAAGMETDIGGTGSKAIGREGFSTFTPTFYFGKGFGDLPDALGIFKPMAVTGTLGVSIPTEAGDSNAIEWGLAVEYSVPYLQQRVKEIGLPAPFKDMIPVVEFAGESPFNRSGGGTTATINPGVLYESQYFQLGVEAMIPVNRDSGEHMGGIVVLEIYIDDLFPKIFGHPIIGE